MFAAGSLGPDAKSIIILSVATKGAFHVPPFCPRFFFFSPHPVRLRSGGLARPIQQPGGFTKERDFAACARWHESTVGGMEIQLVASPGRGACPYRCLFPR